MSRARAITSAQNSVMKLAKRLRGKRGRAAEELFLIDYRRDLERALACGYQIEALLYAPDRFDADEYGACDHFVLSPQLLERVSYRQNPDGMVAIMRSQPPRAFDELRAESVDSVLALVNLSVPGNIGALLRSADAMGLDAVVLVDAALDLYNPNVIRSSTGACFRGNVYWADGGAAVAWLRENRFQLVCADGAGATLVDEVDFRGKTAIALGSEDVGLDSAWLAGADVVARIPMIGAASDSLNVAASGAIFMYELGRQRRRG